MSGALKYLAIVGGLLAILAAYLFHVPHSEGVAQMSRIRLLRASMKTISLIGAVSEALTLAPAWYVQRHSGRVLKQFKKATTVSRLKVEDTTIDGVSVRIYAPVDSARNQNEHLPAVVFYHGGAFYMGSVDTHDPITRELALQTGFVVISVEYRLAPEHPFPAGLDDCVKVTQHVLDAANAEKLNIDAKRVAVAGDSAGGNLAAVVAMRFAKNKAQHPNVPRVQVLIYPVVQFFDFMLPSYRTPALHIFHFGRSGLVQEFYINKSISEAVKDNRHTSIEQKKKFRRLVDWSLIPEQYRTEYKEPLTDDADGDVELVKNAKQLLDPDVSPLLVENEELAELPPTYILTVDHDRLRDEGFIYAVRLKASGVDVMHRHFRNTFHGSLTFLEGPFELDIAHDMLWDIVKYLKDRL